MIPINYLYYEIGNIKMEILRKRMLSLELNNLLNDNAYKRALILNDNNINNSLNWNEENFLNKLTIFNKSTT